jgi:RNA-binding protein
MPLPQSLSATERRALRARAHPLHPVVIVGTSGLTEAVLKEVETALKSHELIKVKLASDDRDERTSQYGALSEALAATRVQQIGKIAILYRQKTVTPEVPAAARPKSGAARRTRPSRAQSVNRRPTAAAMRAPDRAGRATGPASRRGAAKPRAARRTSARS